MSLAFIKHIILLPTLGSQPPQQRPALHGSFGRYQHGRRNAVLHSTWKGPIWIPTAAIQLILRDSQQFLDFKSGLSFQKMKRFMLRIEHHGEEVRYPSRKKKGGPVRLLQPRIFVKPLEVWQVKFRIMNQQLQNHYKKSCNWRDSKNLVFNHQWTRSFSFLQFHASMNFCLLERTVFTESPPPPKKKNGKTRICFEWNSPKWKSAPSLHHRFFKGWLPSLCKSTFPRLEDNLQRSAFYGSWWRYPGWRRISTCPASRKWV